MIINATGGDPLKKNSFTTSYRPATRECESGCSVTYKWFSQLAVIAMGIFFLYSVGTRNLNDQSNLWPWAVSFFMVTYTNYVFMIMYYTQLTFYIINQLTKQESTTYINELKTLNPKIWMRIECYHLVYTKNGTYNSYTHKAQEEFQYEVCEDISSDFEYMPRSEQFVQLFVNSNFKFKDQEDLNYFLDKQETFKNQNKKDTYQNYFIYMQFECQSTTFSNYSFINLNSMITLLINPFTYVLMTFWIPLGIVYEAMLKPFLYIKEHNVEKLISCKRHNLLTSNVAPVSLQEDFGRIIINPNPEPAPPIKYDQEKDSNDCPDPVYH